MSSIKNRKGSVARWLGGSWLAVMLAATAATASASDGQWRAAWAVSPSNATGSIALKPNDTVRQIIHLSAAGSTIRIRLTQRYGTDPAGLGAVSIGRRVQGAEIEPSSLRAVTFGGSRAVNIPAGQSVTSDPVNLPVEAFDDLVLSFVASTGTSLATEHFVAREWPYFSAGVNLVDQPGEAGFTRAKLVILDSFYLLEGVDVLQTPATRTLVAVGDSITDGFVSAFGNTAIGDPRRNGLDERYPDFLALRLADRYPDRYSVVNAGIAGNLVLAAGALAQYGPPLLTRLNQDVLAVPGVTDAILMAGTNDIAASPNNLATPTKVIAGLKQAVLGMKAANLRVLLGTITPRNYAGADNGTAIERARQKVNAWIRTQGFSDGFVDFDACLRDPGATDQLNPPYDSGDHLHPNPAGYAAMANCVDLNLLQ